MEIDNKISVGNFKMLHDIIEYKHDLSKTDKL